MIPGFHGCARCRVPIVCKSWQLTPLTCRGCQPGAHTCSRRACLPSGQRACALRSSVHKHHCIPTKATANATLRGLLPLLRLCQMHLLAAALALPLGHGCLLRLQVGVLGADADARKSLHMSGVMRSGA